MKLTMCLLLAGTAFAADKPTHDWKDGTVRSVSFYPREIDVTVECGDLSYSIAVSTHVLKAVDWVPFFGLIPLERRMKRENAAGPPVGVGDQIKFTLDRQRGWLIDNQGAERKLIVRSVAAK